MKMSEECEHPKTLLPEPESMTQKATRSPKYSGSVFNILENYDTPKHSCHNHFLFDSYIKMPEERDHP